MFIKASMVPTFSPTLGYTPRSTIGLTSPDNLPQDHMSLMGNINFESGLAGLFAGRLRDSSILSCATYFYCNYRDNATSFFCSWNFEEGYRSED